MSPTTILARTLLRSMSEEVLVAFLQEQAANLPKEKLAVLVEVLIRALETARGAQQ